MSDTVKEIEAMEWAVARALEPDPGPISEDPLAHLGGPDLRSPAGLYRAVSVYDEGDIPRWDPLAFGTDGNAMLVLIDTLTARGWLFFMSRGADGAHADVIDTADDAWLGRSGVADLSLPETVLRAVHEALGRRTPSPAGASTESR